MLLEFLTIAVCGVLILSAGYGLGLIRFKQFGRRDPANREQTRREWMEQQVQIAAELKALPQTELADVLRQLISRWRLAPILKWPERGEARTVFYEILLLDDPAVSEIHTSPRYNDKIDINIVFVDEHTAKPHKKTLRAADWQSMASPDMVFARDFNKNTTIEEIEQATLDALRSIGLSPTTLVQFVEQDLAARWRS